MAPSERGPARVVPCVRCLYRLKDWKPGRDKEDCCDMTNASAKCQKCFPNGKPCIVAKGELAALGVELVRLLRTAEERTENIERIQLQVAKHVQALKNKNAQSAVADFKEERHAKQEEKEATANRLRTHLLLTERQADAAEKTAAAAERQAKRASDVADALDTLVSAVTSLVAATEKLDANVTHQLEQLASAHLRGVEDLRGEIVSLREKMGEPALKRKRLPTAASKARKQQKVGAGQVAGKSLLGHGEEADGDEGDLYDSSQYSGDDRAEVALVTGGPVV
ncbi:hypothetical protein GGS21DRAFT_546271 [Xylaria nigripes]|nr:hypothetical protein GGS21DRAFT_546271 [Xylaria nigripes]